MGLPFLSRLGLPVLVEHRHARQTGIDARADPRLSARREDVDVRRQVGDEVVDRHAASFRARLRDVLGEGLRHRLMAPAPA